jgi:hypothetical protein
MEVLMRTLKFIVGMMCYILMVLFAVGAWFFKTPSDWFEALGDKIWGSKGNLIGK